MIFKFKKYHVYGPWVDGKRTLVPLSPQPEEDDVIKIRRIYRTHSLNNSYKRRVTTIINGSCHLACYEYAGMYPGISRKTNREYIRTKPETIDDIHSKVKHLPPKKAYMAIMGEQSSLYDLPRDSRQVENIRAQVMRCSSNNDKSGPKSNYTDHIIDCIKKLHKRLTIQTHLYKTLIS